MNNFSKHFCDELEKLGFFGKKEQEAKKDFEGALSKAYSNESDLELNTKRRKHLFRALAKWLGGTATGAGIGALVSKKGNKGLGALIGAGYGSLGGAVAGMHSGNAGGLRRMEANRRLKAKKMDW